MATQIKQNIVTDGLDILVDVNSINCYPRSGTVVTSRILVDASSNTNTSSTSYVGDPLIIGNDGTGGDLQFSQSTDWATSSFTFSGWGYRDDLSNDRQGRICDQLSAGNGHLRMSLLSTPNFQFRPVAGGSTTILSSSKSIQAQRWYNLVVTKEGTSSGGSAAYVMYLNGEPVDTASSSVLVTSANFTMYRLMRSADDDQTTTSWKGKFGPFYGYTKALSQEEVLQNYNALKGRFKS